MAYLGVQRRLGYGIDHPCNDLRVEYAGDDVIPLQVFIGDAGGDGFGRGHLHLFVDGPCKTLQRSTKDPRKTQHIIHLIGKIAPPRGQNRKRLNYSIPIRRKKNQLHKNCTI